MNAPCGTYAAAMRHRRLKEQLDRACKDAERDYMRQWRTDPEVRKKDRWWNNTRTRALERLAAEYPDRLKELIADERAVGGPYEPDLQKRR